jgi:hypothetical protein
LQKTTPLLLLLVSLSGAATSQMMNCEQFPDPSETPTIYELQKPFANPVALPDNVLALLYANNELAAKLNSCQAHKSLTARSSEPFQALEVNLSRDELPSLIVRAADKCLWEKGLDSIERVPFWMFRQAQTGYELVLAEKTQALQLLKARNAGYPDVCTSVVEAGGEIDRIGYRFRGGKYAVEWHGSTMY